MDQNGNNVDFYNDNKLQDIEDATEFYQAIDRHSLTRQLSPERPYVYWTMEIYDKANGIKGGGGLGILAADTRRVAQQMDIPFVVVTPFFRSESHQAMGDNLSPVDKVEVVSPDSFGFEYVDDVFIKTAGGPDSMLHIFKKQLGSTIFLTISEPNFGQLYQDEVCSDHRLYQEVALGFGGYKALRRVGVKPAVIQLNETATIFAALARLDELCSNGMNIYEAIVYVRKHTLYTNHTLLQGAEGEFSPDQFDKLVMPNIRSKAIKGWIKDQFVDGKLRLNALAIELSEAKNGVSKLHARVANFRDKNNDRVKFSAVTNGIDMKTWVMPETIKMFLDKGIIDKFSLPAEDFIDKINQISATDIRHLRSLGRAKMNQILATRQDQYGNPVNIPEDVLLFDFKRRFVDYKRPYMPFERLNVLKRILLDNNAHYILTGKAHQGDVTMHGRLKEILQLIDQDDILKQRVHYLQDYDEELGLALAVGSDAAVNVPIVGLEACGTSWEKDIANLKLLISTSDGGVADVRPIACLEVSGHTYDKEVDSLYFNMQKAAEIMKDNYKLEQAVRRQLVAYLPVISGTRMLKDYLHFLFPGH